MKTFKNTLDASVRFRLAPPISNSLENSELHDEAKLRQQDGSNGFKIIPGWESYEIDDAGNVRNRSRAGPLLSHRIDRYGYAHVRLSVGGRSFERKVHRLVALVFIPNPGRKPQVNHKDGNKLNNAPSNLEWATARENTRHSHRVLRSHDNSSRRKLTRVQVAEMRALHAQGIPRADLATQFGVTRKYAWDILNWRSWKEAS